MSLTNLHIIKCVPFYIRAVPPSIEEIRLYQPQLVDIRLPYSCKLYIDDVLQ